ncbi:MAG TPA: ATP synthase F1 subunit gamma [Candidatus Polarisedimenticolaceae bacterium]|jgi:F-type H+-transporting ATPase subunit gamma
MAKTQHLKRRIRSVKNTMQVTRAMKMVSAARLRRAQDRIIAARPYARRMNEVLHSLAANANREMHPLLAVRPEERIDVVVIASDRGLCGSFNGTIMKTGAAFLDRQTGKDAGVFPVGRKSREFFRKRGTKIRHEWSDVLRKLDYPVAQEIANLLMDRFESGATDAVYVVYNEFRSAIVQKPVVERLLPIEGPDLGKVATATGSEEHLFEPSAQQLFEALLPLHVTTQVYRALMESAAAEHGARMTAMDSATKNAKELIDRLTLRMNRVRQASITTEIIEVVSGAQALG